MDHSFCYQSQSVISCGCYQCHDIIIHSATEYHQKRIFHLTLFNFYDLVTRIFKSTGPQVYKSVARSTGSTSLRKHSRASSAALFERPLSHHSLPFTFIAELTHTSKLNLKHPRNTQATRTPEKGVWYGSVKPPDFRMSGCPASLCHSAAKHCEAAQRDSSRR